jgi:hypothetical protein
MSTGMRPAVVDAVVVVVVEVGGELPSESVEAEARAIRARVRAALRAAGPGPVDEHRACSQREKGRSHDHGPAASRPAFSITPRAPCSWCGSMRNRQPRLRSRRPRRLQASTSRQTAASESPGATVFLQRNRRRTSAMVVNVTRWRDETYTPVVWSCACTGPVVGRVSRTPRPSVSRTMRTARSST